MPLYTPGRRRAIVLLLLTSVLLITLDLRGNAIFDAARSGFNEPMEPLESAADVATRPVVNAWRGITQWEDVREENDRLRDQLAGQRADQIVAQAAIQDQQELLAERDLPALGYYPRITATVVGVPPEQPRPGHRDRQGQRRRHRGRHGRGRPRRLGRQDHHAAAARPGSGAC